MKVLSLFDGMSCGRIALDQLGIPVEKYYASEIDKYAIQVSQANYPDIEQVGDICNLNPKDYQDVDLILAGSPCQGFSFAGKQLAFDDPRSALFFEFIRLLKAIKPKYFLLENVRMKKEFLEVITEQVSSCYTADDVAPEFKDMFGNVKFEPHFINSSLVSAQSRQRYYWTNIPGIKQPEDRGIVLKDILEDSYDSERDKAHCIDANYYKGANVEQYKKKHRRQLVNKPIKEQMLETATSDNGITNIKKGTSGKSWFFEQQTYSKDSEKTRSLKAGSGSGNIPKVMVSRKRHEIIEKNLGDRIDDDTLLIGSSQKNAYLGKDKSSSLTESMGKGGGHVPMVREPKVAVQSYREVRTDEAKEMRKMVRQKTGKDHTPSRAKKLEPRNDGKVGTITPSLNKDHEISIQKLPDKSQTIKSQYYKSSRANFERQGTFHATGVPLESKVREKSKTVRAGGRGSYDRHEWDSVDELHWRKLTCRECEALQTVPRDYTNHVSNTQRYKMLGNGWTVEVIKHIFKNMEVE
jgi:DNA-cytosine methyltransferase